MLYRFLKNDRFVLLVTLLLIRCATDPGTSTPVAGGAITFTQATGQVRVVSSVEGTSLKSAVVLFDTNSATGELGEATLIEAGVTVTWPDALSFELPGCTATPTLTGSTSYVTSKIFQYDYPDTCTPVVSSEVAAQAVVIVSKNGTVASITDSTSTVSAQTFTTTGSWTAPSGVTSVTVECWGGGGGGGGDTGNGGGGGAYSAKSFISVTPGASYTAHVGSGGVGGSSFSSDGGLGGDSWFLTQETVIAKGGSGGLSSGEGGGAGGASASGVGDTKYSGGSVSLGGGDNGVGGASSAGTSANGVNAVNEYGATAPSGGGHGGNGGVDGYNGTSPGGGGGAGQEAPGNGGSGAAGKVIIRWN